jgi:hypothetical protein
VNLSFFLVQNYLQLWLMTENGCMMVGERMELTHYQTMESRGVHGASVEMVYSTTRKRFQYTFVGSVIC